MNIFQQKYNEFAKQQSEKTTQQAKNSHASTAADIYEDKPFSVEYNGLFTVAKVAQSFAQIITLISTAALVVFAVGYLLPGAGLYAAIPVGLLFAFLVEVLKRKILAIAAKSIIKYKTFGGIGFAGFFVLLVSVAAALVGSYELPAVLYPAPQLHISNEAAARLSADIATIEKDIQAAKGVRGWVAENRTVPRLQAQRTALIQQREQAVMIDREAAQNALSQAQAERNTSIEKMRVYSIGTAVAGELIFLLSTFFVFYFLWRCFAETELDDTIPEPTQSEKTHLLSHNAKRSGVPFSENKKAPQNGKKSRMTQNVSARANATGTHKENTLRVCENCSNEYQYGHNRQRFCTDGCRVQAWQQRTGKTLKRYTIPAEG
jgi:hypothetical protein